MGADELLRFAVGGALVLGALVFLIGGFLTAVSGRWRDGERLVELNQFGPWIRGRAERPGGYETYAGIASFGTVWLSRRDFGLEHLEKIGFAPITAPVVDGTVTARLKFRAQPTQLAGEFVGLRFEFSESPVEIVSQARLPPTDRIWTRV